MDLQLKDKVIIVTGGAKGIGEGIVRLLANEGAIPVIIGRNEADNLKLVKEILATGNNAFQFPAELTRPEDPEKVINNVLQKFGTIHGLVNNAGVNDGVGLANGNYEQFVESLHKNVIHYYLMAHHALPALIKTKGAIVNIGSKVADTGQGGTSAYAASNGARNALTREWAVELLPHGIRVNSVIVAECYTPLYQTWINSIPDSVQKLEAIKAKIPLGKRMTTAEEIASSVAFLLSEVSSHTTGQLIYVDGGYVHLDRSLS
ncbi:L-fucose dehydrogenase [Pedobacter metabolipauper]|uniref:3-oxoacyl-[acyl-carrier protein] reductase/L-fucose dehydrogenase n=1 Tax=Pedobacter metabolipauper TaxID=425513 RepID=A0A4R6SZB7_9SPHI|nr:SDR family oxidoreductase [Pedobacter metabolipauper]TDQ09885.1 3-oxoacyl-[acyl-carrier protein] reductase/L-fucose dehydrogenase [Pedobacter metabolipauper]